MSNDLTTVSSVPLLDLNVQYENLKNKIEDAIQKVLDHKKFIMGPEVKEFEQQMAEYTGAKYAYGCASGSDALLLSLMATGIEQGDMVITTPYTFFATAGAISRLGAIPVFLDINPVTYNLDPNQVEDFLAGNHFLAKRLDANPDKVKAMIPVHLYGQMADMDPLMELSNKYGITVVEDAAQAIGSRYKGKDAGTIGQFGAFSFFPSKNLGGFGDGGLVTVNDDELAEKIAILRVHGSKPKYYHKMVGANSRLDTLQAAVLKTKLPHLDEWSDARRDNANYYKQLFNEADLSIAAESVNCLETCSSMGGDSCNMDEIKDKVVLPTEVEGDPSRGGRHIYHQFMIRTSQRDYLQDKLKEANIGNALYYPVPLHEQECFKYLGYNVEDCPASHCASKQTLALPMYPELNKIQQEYVVETIQKALKR